MLLVVRTMPGPHTARDMAAHLTVSLSAISRTLDRLVELGLMRRALDPAKRRSVLLVPTAAGNAYVAGFQQVAMQAIAQH